METGTMHAIVHDHGYNGSSFTRSTAPPTIDDNNIEDQRIISSRWPNAFAIIDK